ncbi:HNH endonuclease [bacterium]|nr:HNH endonuclease [bacterium]
MPFTDETIQQVWEKGEVVENHDPDVKRKDAAQAWIRKENYGNRDSIYGWEIDHIRRVSDGGTDDISNLRPLQWQNNLAREDDPFSIVVTSEGDENIELD